MDKHEPDNQAAYRGLALRFAKLGKLFHDLGKPEAAQALIESLVVGDSVAFNQLVNQLDFPMINKCVWLQEVVERVICTSISTEEYRLRKPMSRLQFREYADILSRHSSGNEILFRDQTIMPGPFLDELIKAG